MRIHPLVVVLALVPACAEDQRGGPPDPPPVAAAPGGAAEAGELSPALPVFEVCAGQVYETIGAALAAAAATPGATIEVCPGTYGENLVIRAPVIVRGVDGAGVTTIDGNLAGSVVTIDSAGAVVIEGFTIRNGSSPPGGGGVRCEDSHLRLAGVAITGNRTDGDGGGVLAVDCHLELAAVEVTDNVAGGAGGGLSAQHDGDAETGTIDDSGFRHNRAARGGGVHLAANLRLDGNDVVANQAESGAGLFIDGASPTVIGGQVFGSYASREGGGVLVEDSSATFDGILMQMNGAEFRGGAMRISDSRVHIVGVRMTDNITYHGTGGGIDFEDDQSTIEDSWIASNVASRGGGIYYRDGGDYGSQILDTMIYNNGSQQSGGGGEGGGLVVEDSAEPLFLRGVHFNYNLSNAGGAIYTRDAHLRIRNVLFIHNGANRGGGIYVAAGVAEDTVPRVDIAFSTFHLDHAYDHEGAALWVAGPRLTVRGSIIHDTIIPGPLVSIAGPSQVSWSYNDTYPATFAGMADPTGTDGNISAPATYVHPFGDDYWMGPQVVDYHLVAGSAGIDAGPPEEQDPDGTRSDMGAYGGPLAGP